MISKEKILFKISLVLFFLFDASVLVARELVSEQQFMNLFQHYIAASASPVDENQYADAPVADLALVVFPGILGEFYAKTGTFTDVRDKMATLSTPIMRRWNEYRLHSHPLQLPAYDLSRTTLNDSGLGTHHYPLSELFDIFALPADGRLIHVIIFRSPVFSLETFGSQDVAAARYDERLNALFEELGWQPRSIAFLGYSLGSATAYLTLEHIEANQRKWRQNIHSLTSLSGTTYGIRLADAALCRIADAPGLYCELINALFKLQGDLRYVGQKPEQNDFQKRLTLLARPDIVTYNNAIWLRAAASISAILYKYRSFNANLGPLLQELRGLVDGGKLGAAGKIAINVTTTDQRMLADYDQNIKRFKLLLTNARQGVEEMSTQTRRDWFQTHKPFPYPLILHELQALMPEDVSQAESYSFNPDMVDYKIIRENLNMHKKMTGSPAMDGWVGIDERSADLELGHRLNPSWDRQYSGYSYLGTLKTDHWGLAIPSAIPQKGSPPLTHPFPRDALLQALAHTLLLEHLN
jgi:hypothetical protein